MSNRILKGAAGLAALIVIGVGAALIGGASSGDASNGTNAAANAPGAPPGNFGPGGPGQAGRPPGGGPGGGTPATGSDAAKAKAAALAKYPGTAESVFKTQDGNYLVHVLRPSGEVRVLVDSKFAVTGVMQRPPGGRPGAGGQGGPPPGAGGQGGPPPGAPQPPQQQGGQSGSGTTTQ